MLGVTPPVAAAAQPVGRPWRIGLLVQGSVPAGAENVVALREGLRELGYAESRHYALEIRAADGHAERLPGLAAALVALPVDVIVAISTPATLAAMQATRTIPIVTANVADPVGSGLVRSFARPGGNVTGTAWALDEVSRKWLELLRSIRGDLTRVAVIYNSTNPSMPAMLAPLEVSAKTLNVSLTVRDFLPTDTAANVFTKIAGDRPEGVVVLPDSFLALQRDPIAEHALKLRVATIFATRPYVMSGGLISYGPHPTDGARRAAAYIDKILKGAKPGDLPVERPTRFEMVINMKTAKRLGVTIPPTLLVQAEQVH